MKMKYQPVPYAHNYVFQKFTRQSRPNRLVLLREGDLVKDIQLVFKKGTRPTGCDLKAFSSVEKCDTFTLNPGLYERGDALPLSLFFDKSTPSPQKFDLSELPENVDMFRVEFAHTREENSIPLLAVQYNDVTLDVECEGTETDLLGIIVEYIFLDTIDRKKVYQERTSFVIGENLWVYGHGCVQTVPAGVTPFARL